MAQDYNYPAASSVTISAIGPNSGPIPTTSILVAGNSAGTLIPLSVDPTGALNVNVLTPTGLATASNQVLQINLATAGNASLSSIDSKLTAPLSVTGPLTDTQLRASPVPVSASSLPLPTGASTSALQTAGNASLVSIDSKLTSPLAVTGPLTDAQLRATPVPISGTVSTGGLTDAQLRASPVPVSQASQPLPTGAATAANQATEIASLASIDSKLTSPITVTGPLTDTQLRATPVPVSGTVTANAGTGNFTVVQPTGTNLHTVVDSSALPTGAATEATLATRASEATLATRASEASLVAFSGKTAAGFVPNKFDETVIAYVGATTDIDTVTYKLTGSTVATLTLSYDGSNRLTGVVKT